MSPAGAAADRAGPVLPRRRARAAAAADAFVGAQITSSGCRYWSASSRWRGEWRK